MQKTNGHWLTSDFDNREPKDDYHNIDDGKYLQALQELPNSIRLMLQDSEMHIEVEEVGGAPIVTKIIKKREAAYLQGSEHYFIFDNEGKRIPLTEEEFHALVGLKDDPEDVLNLEDINLQSVDSEHAAPMDVWDVIFDSTEYVRQVTRLLENELFQQKSMPEKLAIIAKMQDELIYSADYFPYPQDKRFHSEAAAKIARLIEERDLTKQELGAMLGPRNPEKRIEYVKELRAKAAKMLPGVTKANTLLKAQKVFDQLTRDRKAKKTREYSIYTDSDRAKLWALWRTKEAKNRGEVKLLDWQFQKLYSAKLQKEIVIPRLAEIDQQYNEGLINRETAKTLQAQCKEEVRRKVKEKMEALYNKKNAKPIEIQRTKAPILSVEIPQWLVDAPPMTQEPSESFDAFDVEYGAPGLEEVSDDWYGIECEIGDDFIMETLLERE